MNLRIYPSIFHDDCSPVMFFAQSRNNSWFSQKTSPVLLALGAEILAENIKAKYKLWKKKYQNDPNSLKLVNEVAHKSRNAPNYNSRNNATVAGSESGKTRWFESHEIEEEYVSHHQICLNRLVGRAADISYSQRNALYVKIFKVWSFLVGNNYWFSNIF